MARKDRQWDWTTVRKGFRVVKNRMTWNRQECGKISSMLLLLSWLWQKTEKRHRSFIELAMFKHIVDAHQMVIIIIP